jgi:hypothetical protein
MKIIIDVAEVPPTINKLSRSWRSAWRKGKEWQQFLVVGTTAKQRRELSQAKGMRTVSIYCRHMKLWDADNAQSANKVILDAGTRLGFWENDSNSFVMVTPVQQERAKKRSEVLTRIVIETEVAE